MARQEIGGVLRAMANPRDAKMGVSIAFPYIPRLFNLTSVFGWLENPRHIAGRRLCGSSMFHIFCHYSGSISAVKAQLRAHFTSTLVRGCWVDISLATIRRFLYGPTMGHSWSLNTVEFDYRWDIVRSSAFQRNAE
ncbi:hypothetical protein H5410_037134 [Solanum commersonii]|uniref:Uncharacterized protein n=1 Tax=Solanum commersonii TaxID=4109 RepID=A0A9J5YAB0_SOLCO|nr:hypothetical protein H5410_037134 [Solanum commersonii]